MRISITIILALFLNIILYANNDRALYIKKYSNESKIALIIGNSKYKHFSKLKNSKNDAYDMKNVLKAQGFDVLYLQDGTLRDMKKIVRKFTKKLRNGGVGFFFYAGHGLEVDGKNYLIPTNANIPEKDEVEYESLSMNMIIDKMENSNNRLNIVVLDACRNDPFSRSGGGGLAQINNAKGMYIAFATSPGSVASDGSKKDRNGLFTKHLINNIKKSNLELDRVFKNTRIAVSDDSDDRQRPWTSSSVNGDFYFKIDKNIEYLKSKKKENSTFTFKDKKSEKYTLTINTNPYNAEVQIVNIMQKYHDGIELKKGNYEIKISKNGYITKDGNIDLKSNLSLNIELKKKNQNNKTKNFIGSWNLFWDWNCEQVKDFDINKNNKINIKFHNDGTFSKKGIHKGNWVLDGSYLKFSHSVGTKPVYTGTFIDTNKIMGTMLDNTNDKGCWMLKR